MPDSTTVNPQITDAVTQANVKVLGEAPAMAMGAIYQTMAHSTGILFENAVAAQQQQNVLAMAAANQGVMQIYTLDTTAAAGAGEKVGQSDVPDNMLALLTALRAAPAAKAIASPQTVPGEAADDAPSASPAKAAGTNSPDLNPQIKDAVEFTNEVVLGRSAAFVAAVHACSEEMADALEAMNRVTHDNLFRMLQEAALAATFAAMIRTPEKAKEYEAVLQAIRALG